MGMDQDHRIETSFAEGFPVQWNRLAKLGIHPIKLAILRSVIEHEGRADSLQIRTDLAKLAIPSRTVQNHLSDLVVIGYLAASNTRRTGGERGKRATYTLQPLTILEDLRYCNNALPNHHQQAENTVLQ